jgi:DNA polymerase III subunit delta
MMGIEQIKQKVKNAPPIAIALGGDERALVEDALLYLREVVLSKDSKEFNHHHLQAGEDDLSQTISMLKTMPFIGQFRLIEIHDAEKLDADITKDIIDYLEDPVISSVLILVFNKIDKRNKLVSTLGKKDFLYVFESANEEKCINFVLSEFSSLDCIINHKTAQFLVMVLDNNLLAIKAAIKKLSLLFEKREITIEDIEHNIFSHQEKDVFFLARLISEGKLAKSLVIFQHLRSTQDSAVKCLGVIIWQFRVLLHIRYCLEQKMSDFDIRKEVSVYGDRFIWMIHVAKKRNMAFHVNRLTRLIECDLALKTQNIQDKFNFIEKVIYQSAVGL